MKKVLFSFTCLFLFLVNNIIAQELVDTAVLHNSVETTFTHIGTDNGYPIGDESHPVTLQEYCLFLNLHNGIDFVTNNDKTIVSTSSESYITSTKVKEPKHNVFYYTYTLRSNCENFIIDELTSLEEQQWFQNWRSRPTTAELCDYINNLIEDLNNKSTLHHQENAALEKRYPEAMKRHWFFYAAHSSLFEKAHCIAKTLFQAEPGTFMPNITDGNVRLIIKVVADKNAFGTHTYVTPIQGEELLRPEDIVF